MLKRLGLINKNQRGFTLLEVMVVVIITAIVSGGIGTAVLQVINGNTRSSNHMAAVRQVQEAGYWVSHDSQMAQSSDNGSVVNGFPLTLTWRDFEGGRYDAIYSLLDTPGSSLKMLQRSYSVNGTIVDNIVVARYIDASSPVLTSCNKTAEEVIILTITAVIGTDSHAASETRVYEIIPKPIL